jgi:DNA-binding transcriptional MerR regulator
LNDTFHIGGLARATGRSVHTIRWYEAQGLIPRVERDRGGRRVYHRDHLEHLDFLEWLRRSGMSVASMRRFTDLSMAGWRTLGERQDLLAEHRAHVQAQIRDLKAALALIDAKVGFYAEWEAAGKRPPPLPALPVRG